MIVIRNSTGQYFLHAHYWVSNSYLAHAFENEDIAEFTIVSENLRNCEVVEVK